MKENRRISHKAPCIFFMALCNAFAMAYVTGLMGAERSYYGVSIYGWNSSCVAFFALDCIMLHRFLRLENRSPKGKMVLSVLLGLAVSLLAMGAVRMFYGRNDIFGDAGEVLTGFFAAIGLSFFFIPCFSELTGLLDRTRRAKACGEGKERFWERKPWFYFLFVFVITFLSFLPLFLYWWPVNFIYDANYQVRDYLEGTISTHHPILHTLLLGKTYAWGLERGNVNWGMMVYSLLQMILLSGAFAFFMEYLCEKKVRRGLRVLIFVSFLCNPVNGWFSISTIKGVLSAAFLLLALTILLRFFDCGEKALGRKTALAIGFVFFCILASLFRNNMAYAVVAGGIIIAVLRKGWKEKLFFFCVILLFFGGYKGTNHLLIKATHATEADTKRESMSVPLSCLARAAICHRDRIGEEDYQEILTYLSEDALAQYSIFIADPVKNDANEGLLRENQFNFLKLVFKVGLRCPGDYVEAVIGLTAGYWYPLDYPYFFTGTTKMSDMGIFGTYPAVENQRLLPFGNALFDYLFGESDGRLRIPLWGWFWRNTLYVWGFLYAACYLIYRRSAWGISILLIPLAYLLTCFLGPVSWMRYVYVNIATIPVAIYLCVSEPGRDAGKPACSFTEPMIE